MKLHAKSHLYLLLGDPAAREEARAALVTELSRSCDPPPEVIRFYGDDDRWHDAFEQARTFPFLSSRQIILLSRIDELSKSDLDRLTSFLPNVPPFTTLICEADSADKRTGFYQTFVKQGIVKEFVPDQSGQLGRSMGDFLSVRRKRIRHDAAAELVERLGGNTMLIYQALDQLSVFLGDREEITADDVSVFVERQTPYGPFELTDALAEKNTAAALRIFRYLRDFLGQDPAEIVGLLAWQLRRLWEVKVALRSGMNEYNLARELSIPPFAVKRLLAASRRFSPDDIQHACQDLFYLDWKIKTGRADKSSALEDFLLRWSGPSLVQC